MIISIKINPIKYIPFENIINEIPIPFIILHTFIFPVTPFHFRPAKIYNTFVINT
jgi:hypothetical protein